MTYLFEGEILHRDSLGTVQPIRAGEVNWMTAGRGIVHSERTPAALRETGSRLAGIQLWVALPLAHEEAEPSFAHHSNLPVQDADGVRLRVILGRLRGQASPVQTMSDMLYVDATLARGGELEVPSEYDERAVYVVDGSVAIGADTFAAGELAVLAAHDDVRVSSAAASRVLLFAGAPLDAPRFVWWNFVSSRAERIREAAADWKAGRFAQVPGDGEFIFSTSNWSSASPRSSRWRS